MSLLFIHQDAMNRADIDDWRALKNTEFGSQKPEYQHHVIDFWSTPGDCAALPAKSCRNWQI